LKLADLFNYHKTIATQKTGQTITKPTKMAKEDKA